ncbi:MAG TPA: alginate export family protein [Verrucomicrobiota bacterium]|nr:alginate export family protein [Verrucomicrobiota bacterium]
MKKHHIPHHTSKILTGGALVLAAVSTVFAQEKAATPAPAAGGTNTTFAQKFTEAFTKGKVNINARLRYEFVDQDPTFDDDSNALTIRTRLGFTTAPLYGFQGMLELENNTAIPNDNNYNAAGSNNEGNRPVVADPPTTEVNQAWLSHTFNYDDWKTTTKGGRQRIALDNHRFIGDVGWRQNMQTFDAFTLTSSPVKDLNLFYGYIGRVKRVFGDVNDLPAANKDFDGCSHALNASYIISPLFKLTAYSYLLDLHNSAGDANSCASYGGSLTGTWVWNKEKGGKLNYRAEYAYQTDYADQPIDYSASYVCLEAGADYGIFNLGGGYELLGSDDGTKGFATPLATLHAFNGWADAFLNTPADGLQDLYAFAGVKLPGNIPVKFVYHYFCADNGNANYGQEFDAVASHSFNKNWTVLVKYAYFDGKAAPTAYDAHKFWAQVEFNY